MEMLKVAKAKGTILKKLKKIERLDMLILDDFGIQPFDSQVWMNLMDIIEDRHGKKSTVITSQVPIREENPPRVRQTPVTVRKKTTVSGGESLL